MTRPAKPPRSVWVHPTFAVTHPVDGWTRYDLHRPRKAKKRKGKRSKS